MSQAPSLHDLGVAGDDLDARRARGFRHRAGDPAQQVNRHAFLDDRRAGKIQRPRAADREIVDGAADRELADIAAGEEQGIDDEGIGGEGEPVAQGGEIGEIEARLIFERRQRRVVEGAHEHVVDQILHRLAAAAMGERDGRHMNLAQLAAARGASRRSFRRLMVV